ncbi:DNA-binding protein [Candidatus Woesearchaeota archaeon]|nr:DNA-binding protein [Candidatus Woesearchaeota archaeon]
MPKSKKVVLDTNFLLIPGQFKVDIFSELDRVCQFAYTLYVLDMTRNELENIIQKQRGKQKEAAKLALALVKAKNINTLPSASKNVDDALVALADKDTFIATQDVVLKRRLKGKVGGIITLRQKKYLIIS